jgi:hypothetical protein
MVAANEELGRYAKAAHCTRMKTVWVMKRIREGVEKERKMRKERIYGQAGPTRVGSFQFVTPATGAHEVGMPEGTVAGSSVAVVRPLLVQ